jgi:hypothetical protein
MNAKYSWHAAYRTAIFETNSAVMSQRIDEALSAFEERRLAPVETGSDEDRALEYAERSILALKAERVDSFEAQ